MTDWARLRDEALRVVRTTRTTGEAATQLGVTADALRSAWLRWRARWPQIPDIATMQGCDLPRQALEFHPLPPTIDLLSVPPRPAPEPEVLIPGEVSPPEASPDSLFVHAGDVPSGIFSDGDNHYGVHDPIVEAAKLAWLRDVRPSAHVNVGDQYDAFLLSRYDKPAARALREDAPLKAEFASAAEYWKTIAEVCSSSHFILGNHENRLQRLIDANPGLFGIFDWSQMAGLPPAVRVHAYGSKVRIGSVTWEHGDRIGGRFGILHPSHWLLSNKGHKSTIFGHTHRIESRLKTVWDEGQQPHVYGAWNQGHGSDVRAAWHWAPEPSWQHGFAYVECFTVAGKPRFTVHQFAVVDGRFSWGGKMYDGRKWM